MTVAEGPWTITGAIAAIVAALIALASLIAILKQITLAREEISLVRDDLNNSKQALKYAQEQSHLVQRQMEEMNRRPILDVCGRGGGNVTYCVGYAAIGLIMVPFYYRNIGTRRSMRAQFEIFVPWETLPGAQRAEDQMHVIEKQQYRRYVWHEDDMNVIWPTHVPIGDGNYRLGISTLPPRTQFFWRAYDDYGVHPTDAEFGRIEVQMPS
ncbi:MAG TPA: hypothetical protein VK669_00985 [Candidatus Limnocylindrales bacterium]|nr:hypothetical protein [Candidatus Limnocylindrales bacterium]